MLASDSRARNGVENAILVVDPPIADRQTEAKDSSLHEPKLSIQVTDSITAALSVLREKSPGQQYHSHNRVGILNMASPLRPGGGVLNGATSQEEFLCLRTTLYPSLKESFYRLPEVGGVWTPDVLIFRSGDSPGTDLEKGERRHVGVLSAAMLRFPDIDDDGAGYANEKDRGTAEAQMRATMRIFHAQNINHVILGAWGCGAYGNPIKEIASLWRKVLRNGPQQEPWAGVKEVIFAIRDNSTAEEFGQWFGDDLVISRQPEVSVEEDEDADDTASMELELKIADIKVQISNARTPLLRTGLEGILNSLERQLHG
ncbi:TIGR02452 family protein [Arthroderma uncinatum]|uniref:TIGR02452 family protein n=1 Tax=Arthroderma uncinatum TaxID=74035 RepID=UPI00144AE932|nr:TIGR02452 family protein [Arthroderma uncinatum]KAF3484209.1 TIGR02452 family protein [Arthroderma uncinatum]